MEEGADLRGAGGVGDAVEGVDAQALLWGEVELVELCEGEAWTGDDDPVGEVEEGIRGTPAADTEEGVEADDGVDGVVGGEGGAEVAEGVDGVVGGGAEGGVECGGLECGVVGAEEAHHGEAVAEGGRRADGFERLAACGGEEDLIEREGCGCGAGDGEMPEMGWVEAAAEESYAHGGCPAKGSDRPG